MRVRGRLELLRAVGMVAALLAAATLAPAGAEPASGDRERDASAWLATIRADTDLQSFVDETIRGLRARDAALRQQTIRAAIIDLPTSGPPRLAHWKGDSPVYPASVPKFVYLMATLAWRDAGMLEIDPSSIGTSGPWCTPAATKPHNGSSRDSPIRSRAPACPRPSTPSSARSATP